MGSPLAGGRRRNLSDLVEHARAIAQHAPTRSATHHRSGSSPANSCRPLPLHRGTATLAGTGPHLTDPIRGAATVCLIEDDGDRARPTGARKRPRPGSRLAA